MEGQREMKRCLRGEGRHHVPDARLTIAALAVVFASFSTSALARVVVTQIQLTEFGGQESDHSIGKTSCRRT
jgi:hypothetical protein